ncbi:SLC13 family permease [Polymorphum gilvum]|uniref:Na/dicarboxylate cotransporter-like protein n=1 Tax=Polymorphum gilvum (strain LMG 25793 / CGMCC 1.9160 / SL003B-26A1) TaxID=991905 RepID=F2IWD8_POLGS|nr:DASS family sodium-coupled anion symporter [Polymorphum gilvum]ADZ69237.1 Na/dicarboxylate cotransporter-like protein [Polymorphum gilvum SL003B-26A1]
MSEQAAFSETAAPSGIRRVGLIAGPILSLAILLTPAPAGLGPSAQAVAAVGVLMAVWWMTEAVPLAITALLPLVLFPLLGARTLDATAVSYSNPLIFLFLGGFILARALERWNLHRRLAARVVRLVGEQPAAVIGGVMAITAFLSMWISNTATAMVMLPIGQSIVARYVDRGIADPTRPNGFSPALMLSIAYAATIGGMGTLIGTPPNALFAGYMKDAYGVDVGFATWMLVGIPVVLVLLPLAWLQLTRVTFRMPALDAAIIQREAPAEDVLPPMGGPEKTVAAVMSLVALGWLTRPLIDSLVPGLGLTDAGIAMTGAVLLFLLPADWKKGEFLLRWADLKALRWDVLILFGGGLALAGAIGDSGLAEWIGSMLSALERLPEALMILLVMAIIVYLGELASNTAMAAVFLPVAGAAAVGMGADPLSLALPVALAASLGFMLPVATPPNAIVFGSGAVTGAQMLRAGMLLNVIAIAVVAVVATTLAPLVFGP